MAKGQKRSNREIRKPKQEKVATSPQPLSGAQVRQADSDRSAQGRIRK
jgi:hypothetical protein